VNVIETSELGKRYGKTWALRDCTLGLPAGHLAALVGPNGAGKSTLMNMVVGLTVPTAGTATVLGGQPAGSSAALDGVAFVAQDAPVYKNLSSADMIHLTANLNQRFDLSFAKTRLADLGIPLKKKAGKLSGGQQAQLALTLALARKPRLLILDEPLASLDPVARQDFLAAVMTAMADDGVSVLLSSHQVAELERVADYLIVLSRAQLQVAGEVDDLLACHRLLTGPTAEADAYSGRLTIVQTRRGGAQTHLLVRASGTDQQTPPGWESHQVSLEEMVMAYLRAPGGRAPGEAADGGAAPGSGSGSGAEAVFAGLTPAGPALVQPAAPTEVIR
jgi:ABC-2 type transport system ATP-binding protein